MSHILIVGAGVAGLVAARSLIEKNHMVTILEARTRTGGRIHTFREKFSRPVEAGAEFIHGKQPLTFSLLKEAEGNAVLLKGRHYTLYKDDFEKGDTLDDQWRAFNKELKKLKVDVALQPFLDSHFGGDNFAELRARVKGFAEGFDIADTTRASTMSLGDEWMNNDEEHQYHIDNGYEIIVRFLEKQVTNNGGAIILSAAVEEIHWKPGHVKTLTADGKHFEADKILVTVPAGVMHQERIRFSPSIPTHHRAFHDLGFGGVIKFLFEFDTDFWAVNQDRIYKKASFIFSDAEIPTWWTPLPERTPLLTGWLGGPPAAKSTHDREALYEKAQRSLQYILKMNRNDIESHLVHWHIADWVVEPYSEGAYTYPTLKSVAAKTFLSQGIDNTIFFAGEGLYEGKSPGTVEAAIVSGMELSEKIIVNSE